MSVQRPNDALRCVRLVVVKASTNVRIFGLSRVAVGLWLALAPSKAGEMWFGSASQADSTIPLLRSVGGRDVGLGLGLATDPRATSSLLPIGIVADAADAIAALLVRSRIPQKNFRAAFAAAVIYAGVGAAIMSRRSTLASGADPS
jgi:hypothetical protein